MANPITSVFEQGDVGGIRNIRQLAARLLKACPELFAPLDPATRSLEPRLAKLDRGLQLDWWRDRPGAVSAVAKLLGIKEETFNLNGPVVRHQFVFQAFPQLRPLNLSREDRYSIGRPELLSDGQGVPPAWKNLDYWFFGEGTNPSPQHLDWLQVSDKNEFDLMAAHFQAASRHAVFAVDMPAQPEGGDREPLKHRSPLILIVRQRVGAAELQVLRARALMAPLLIISRYALPDSRDEGVADSAGALHAAGEINAWRWTLHTNWREILLRWVGKRLSDGKASFNFDPESLIAWLARVDPDCAWFPQTVDVLQLCSVVHKEPFATLHDLETNRGGLLLLGRLFDTHPNRLKSMEELAKMRWLDWARPWDVDLDAAEWIHAGATEKRFAGLVEARCIVERGNRYGFANALLARLLLRRAIENQIRTEDVGTWWPGCFDDDRRRLLDSTLGTMTMAALVAASAKQRPLLAGEEHLAGPAEALFVAIARRLVGGAKLRKEMGVVGRIVLDRWCRDPDTSRPWSRPINTLDQSFEWLGSMWVWSLCEVAPPGAPASWFVPGWSRDLPDQLPAWLNPRASFHTGDWPVPQGASLGYFMDVTYLWVGKRDAPLQGLVPALLKPALLWRAATGAWHIDEFWWNGFIGVDWAENALLTMLDRGAPGSRHSAARTLWASLIGWQRTSIENRRGYFGRSKDLELPSCRPGARQFSPVLAWAANQLVGTEVLDVLQCDEDRRFLETHPQFLLTHHKVLVLDALSARLPLTLHTFEVLNYFSPFLPDAAVGLVGFLHDGDLGAEAAAGVWGAAPEAAIAMLESGEGPFVACQNLLLTCPSSFLEPVLSALRRAPALLPADRRQQWVHFHLPKSGSNAQVLFDILRS